MGSVSGTRFGAGRSASGRCRFGVRAGVVGRQSGAAGGRRHAGVTGMSQWIVLVKRHGLG